MPDINPETMTLLLKNISLWTLATILLGTLVPELMDYLKAYHRAKIIGKELRSFRGPYPEAHSINLRYLLDLSSNSEQLTQTYKHLSPNKSESLIHRDMTQPIQKRILDNLWSSGILETVESEASTSWETTFNPDVHQITNTINHLEEEFFERI